MKSDPKTLPPAARGNLFQRNPTAALAAVLLVAAVIRLVFIADTSYWLDELWTAELSTGRGSLHLNLPVGEVIPDAPATTHLDGAPSWTKVWGTMQDATHPPLYFLILRFWREAFGGGDVAGRMLSVLCSLAAIGLLYDVCRRLHGVGPALWAAAIMAIAQPQLRYAYEVRNYAFLLAVALGAASALVRIEQGGLTRLRWVAMFLCMLAMMLTHYLVGGALAAMFLYALLRLRGRTRVVVAAAFVAAGIAFLALWGPSMFFHVRRFSTHDMTTRFLEHKGPGFLRAWAISLFSRPFVWLWGERLTPRSLAISTISGVLFIAPWFALRRRPDLLFWALWVTGALGFIAILDLARATRHMSFVRYTLLASPGAYALCAGLCSHLRRTWEQHALPAVALGIAAAAVPSMMRQEQVYDWRILAAALRPEVKSDTLLIFSAPGHEEWVSRYFYLAYSHYASEKRPAVLLLDQAATPETLQRVSAYRNIWMVTATPIFPDLLLPDYGGRLYGIDGFKNAVLWHLEPRPPSTRKAN